MSYWMGIDGGGTSLRVVIVDDDMQPQIQLEGGPANPSSIGHAAARDHIQQLVQQALAESGLATVTGAGIGIAGASNEYATDWLLDCLRPVLTTNRIIPSSDMEIALVGGRGQQDGILLLAGTGSVALGINAAGTRLRVGGWGYLLGDEGSGYWIGTRALQVCTRWADAYSDQHESFCRKLLVHLGLRKPLDLIDWRYQKSGQKDVAALARFVLERAESGDKTADAIIAEAAQHLVLMGQHLMQKLDINSQSIVFAGSLLTNQTRLSQYVVAQLGLEHSPISHYPPVIGAALLAKLKET
jgi:glucosamine kinase